MKDRIVCKSCYKRNRRKINNTLIQNRQPKIDNVKKNNNNGTLSIGFSNCGKTYLLNYILLQKEETFFEFTKSLNQYPNIKAQTSDEIQPIENYESSTLVCDDIWLSKQEGNMDLFSSEGRHNKIDIYHISQSYFHLPKKNYS